jgi:glycine cleavage system regulatory protein
VSKDGILEKKTLLLDQRNIALLKTMREITIISKEQSRQHALNKYLHLPQILSKSSLKRLLFGNL